MKHTTHPPASSVKPLWAQLRANPWALQDACTRRLAVQLYKAGLPVL